MAPRVPSLAVIEFLAELALDRLAGATKPLAHYLARYPGHDAELAAAYAETHASPAPSFATDRRTLGTYRLSRELGRGGQGVVWLAEDTRIGRSIALKIVPKTPSTIDLAPRLQREARAASRVDHPGLCAIYDVGSDDHQAWIAMRFVEGESLARHIERKTLGSFEARLELVERIARALHAAHQAGVIHRDVKPGNVMITPSGEPVVLDFGIARAGDEGHGLTKTGDLLGTPAYMAPELLRGDRADRGADVWALGITACECFGGPRPFEAPTREALVRAILEDDPQMPSEWPRDLVTVFATALEKDLSRRYGTASEFADDLRRVREHEPIRARPATAALRFRRWVQRNPRLAASLGALSLVVLVALLVTSTLLKRTNDALARRDTLVRDVTQLADQTAATGRLAEVAELWPATEVMQPRFEAWLAAADELLGRREAHELARDAISVRTDLDPDPARNATARDWLLAQLNSLLATLDQLRELRPEVSERLERARTLRVRSIEDHARAWSEAIERIASDPRFGGLRIEPQLGLVPLGPDLRSNLEEFAHLESGAVPTRDAKTGRLVIDDVSAIVFVLIPPGEFNLGAIPPSAEHPLGSPNVHIAAERWDGPLVHVALEPFFISKFEMTRGAWLRHRGSDPSKLMNDEMLLAANRGLFPVESVAWDDASRCMRELALDLPTEAQWEFAARAGASTAFYTGDDVASLAGHANVADRSARERGNVEWNCADEFDDGFIDLAPAGTFASNPFGLHDVHGNVSEWCRDTWEDLTGVKPRANDGLITGREIMRVQRGGGFSHHPHACALGRRTGSMPSYVAPMWGLRPARALVSGDR